MNEKLNLEDNLTLHGHCKIELTDQKSGKIKTIEKHNKILDCTYNILKIARLKAFYNFIFGNFKGNDETINRMQEKLKKSSFMDTYTIPCGSSNLECYQLCMYDYSQETPNNVEVSSYYSSASYPQNNAVAYANFQNYAPTGVSPRGNPVIEEWDFTDNKIKLVFEFNMQQGNGSFQTVCLANSGCATQFIIKKMQQYDFFSLCASDFENDIIYIATREREIFKININTWETEKLDIILPSEYTNASEELYYLKYNNNKLYFILYKDTNTDKFTQYNRYFKADYILEYDLTDRTFKEFYKRADYTFKTCNEGGNLFFIGDDVYMIFYNYSGTSKSYLAKYNPTTKKFISWNDNTEDTILYTYSPYTLKELKKRLTSFCYNNVTKKIYCNSEYYKLYFYDSLEDLINGNMKERSTYCIDFKSKKILMLSNSIYLNSSKNFIMYTLSEYLGNPNLFTALLLDAPVTKTEDQTMKVTYTLSYELPEDEPTT